MLRNNSKALLLVLLFGVILVVLFRFLLFFGEIGVSFVVVASVCHSMQNTRAYRRPHFNKAVFAVHFPLSSPPSLWPNSSTVSHCYCCSCCWLITVTLSSKAFKLFLFFGQTHTHTYRERVFCCVCLLHTTNGFSFKWQIFLPCFASPPLPPTHLYHSPSPLLANSYTLCFPVLRCN